MVARSTVSRYVLSTRAVHLPEHADGGVPDRIRVRECSDSPCFRILLLDSGLLSTDVHGRMVPLAAIVTQLVTRPSRSSAGTHGWHAPRETASS